MKRTNRILLAIGTGAIAICGVAIVIVLWVKISANRTQDYWALVKAVEQGDEGRVRELVAEGARVNTRIGRFDYTALEYALKDNRGQIARFLVQNGAEVDSATSYGTTPLLWACRNNDLETAKLLLKKGARIDRADGEGITPLMQAALYADAETVKFLIAQGADPKAKCHRGYTALYWRYLRMCHMTKARGEGGYVFTHESDVKSLTKEDKARFAQNDEAIRVLQEAGLTE